jgi:hypothetical protein
MFLSFSPPRAEAGDAQKPETRRSRRRAGAGDAQEPETRRSRRSSRHSLSVKTIINQQTTNNVIINKIKGNLR